MESYGKIFVEISVFIENDNEKSIKIGGVKVTMAENEQANLSSVIVDKVTDTVGVTADVVDETMNENPISTQTPLQRLSDETSESLIKKFALDETIPVNLDELLYHYDVYLYETDFSEVEKTILSKLVEEKGLILGAVAEVNEKIQILYRKKDRPHRQRFTIAHELAHCCINAAELAEKGHIEFRTDMHSNDANSIEHKANIFAGELLIPEKCLTEIYKTTDKPDINYLAKLFDVSVSVMQARLEYLSLPFRVHRLDF